MPATMRKTIQCTLYGGTPSDLENVKDKNIITQKALTSLNGTWFNYNPKLVLIPEKSLYVKLSQFYDNVISKTRKNCLIC